MSVRTGQLWDREVEPAFVVHEPDVAAEVSMVVHVPHAGTALPDDVRAGIVLDDEALTAELVALTDWHTDRLVDVPAAVRTGATAIVNRVSRLAVDVERLPDAREPMAAKGLAAVYTRTSAGAVLREPTAAQRRALLARFFHPWAETMERLVGRLVAAHQRCLIVDVHSFPSQPLPYEQPGLARPQVCLGFADPHAPMELVDELEQVCRAAGRSVARNEPFAGAYVPLSRCSADPRVQAVMIELNRGTYCDEDTGRPHAGFDDTAALLAELVTRCAVWARGA